MAEESLQRWAAQRIGGLLQMPPDSCTPIVENILAYDNKEELKSFLGDFTEKAAEHKVNTFVEELFDWRSGGSKQRGNSNGKEEPQVSAARGRDNAGAGGSSGGGAAGDAGGRGRGRGGAADGARGRGARGGAAPQVAKDTFPASNMPVFARQEGDRRLMVIDAASGRHEILTNCLNCGKVVTEEEGWGPCLFCGNPLEVGDRFGQRHGDDRGFMEPVGQATAEEEKYNQSFEKAKATKDRLLSYDRDAKKRTKVFDDATDWYSESVNPWLSEKQREEATRKGTEQERKLREEKRRIHAKIDLFGRTVISTDAEVEEAQKTKGREDFQAWTENISDKNRLLSMMQQESKGMAGQTSQLSNESQQLYDKLRASLHASGRDRYRSAFQPNDGKEAKRTTRWDASADTSRVEDEFSNVSVSDFSKASSKHMGKLLPVEESPYGDDADLGHCLSMHQPWASLLVHGFKRAEGRTWRSQHRGRLWIHAASKASEDHEVEMLEQTYRSIYEAQGVPMPPMPSECSGYPTSALLGCVDFEDCFTKEQYTEVLRSNPSMPQEENDSEFIFWCLRPRRLAVPLKMGGEHKIWRLPKVLLAAAQRGLQPVRWPAPTEGQQAMSSPSLPGDRAVRRDEAKIEEDVDGEEDAAANGSAASAATPTIAATSVTGASASAASTARAAPAPLLDLWPKEKPEEVLEKVDRDRDGTDRDIVVLQNGFVQLVGFVPRDVQQRIVDELRGVGVSERGFFAEQFDGVKVSSSVMRMYLGMHWNSVSQSWETSRGNAGGAPVAELPKLFLDMYDEAVKRANRELAKPQHKKRKLTPFQGPPPTLGVVNFFTPAGSMQMHQDKTESKASMDAGYPVLGICLGDACEFTYGSEAPMANRKPKVIRMESGDVYLFGGESRMLWHGVTKVLPRTAPPLRLLPGRLSVTLRVL